MPDGKAEIKVVSMGEVVIKEDRYVSLPNAYRIEFVVIVTAYLFEKLISKVKRVKIYI